MIGRWLQAWRRRAEDRAAARRAIPDDLWKRTLGRYPFLRRRDPADAAALRRLASLFLDRKEFSTVGGLVLRDHIAVAIAAQACLPVLRLGLERYDGFVGIVVSPEPVRLRREHVDEAGVHHEGFEELSGQAQDGGPMLLSWPDVRRAGLEGGMAYNVVIHEFAHVMDLADGRSDGVPPLPPDIPRAEWTGVLRREYEGFVARVDAGEVTALDPYGANGEDELFAVASESFFVDPRGLKAEHPALYGVFSRFYRQDPAEEGYF
ncbi:MAG: zinc-dependent peptidase [Rubrivivax sp.]